MKYLVKDLLGQAVTKFVAVRDNSAQIDAEVLMMYLLGYTRAQLYARLNDEIDTVQAGDYDLLVERRVQGEPIAYITNHREFMALDFYVDKRVLVPRPETELLVELTVQKLVERGWESENCTIADIGTGSGVIAVYLALRFPKAKVIATDISFEALQVAEKNARYHEVDSRILFLQGNLLEPLPEAPQVLVSNPPYTILAQVEPNVARYEPNVALDGGAKGLSIYRELLRQARTHIGKPGLITLEIGSEQATDVTNLSHFFFPNSTIEVFKDYAGLDRVVTIEVNATEEDDTNEATGSFKLGRDID
jgi:release factor glutamine methyltransferase